MALAATPRPLPDTFRRLSLVPRAVSDAELPYNEARVQGYDRNVPILWYGYGIAPGLEHREAHVRDIAATLSWLLGVEAPPTSAGRLLDEVLR